MFGAVYSLLFSCAVQGSLWTNAEIIEFVANFEANLIIIKYVVPDFIYTLNTQIL